MVQHHHDADSIVVIEAANPNARTKANSCHISRRVSSHVSILTSLVTSRHVIVTSLVATGHVSRHDFRQTFHHVSRCASCHDSVTSPITSFLATPVMSLVM